MARPDRPRTRRGNTAPSSLLRNHSSTTLCTAESPGQAASIPSPVERDLQDRGRNEEKHRGGDLDSPGERRPAGMSGRPGQGRAVGQVQESEPDCESETERPVQGRTPATVSAARLEPGREATAQHSIRSTNLNPTCKSQSHSEPQTPVRRRTPATVPAARATVQPWPSRGICSPLQLGFGVRTRHAIPATERQRRSGPSTSRQGRGLPLDQVQESEPESQSDSESDSELEIGIERRLRIGVFGPGMNANNGARRAARTGRKGHSCAADPVDDPDSKSDPE